MANNLRTIDNVDEDKFRLSRLLDELAEEVRRAQRKHGPMASPHEGYAVLLEEVDELWDEVKAQQRDLQAMRKEALQVAAMGVRFILDTCYGTCSPGSGD